MNQCWLITNQNLWNIFQWNLNANTGIFIQENALENAVCKMTVILSHPYCDVGSYVKFTWYWTDCVFLLAKYEKRVLYIGEHLPRPPKDVQCCWIADKRALYINATAYSWTSVGFYRSVSGDDMNNVSSHSKRHIIIYGSCKLLQWDCHIWDTLSGLILGLPEPLRDVVTM